MTAYNMEHHENSVPQGKAIAALSLADRLYSSFEDRDRCIAAMMLLLSDVPVEPLMSADQEQKGSVLGLVALGFVMNEEQCGSAARRIVEKADGVIILRLHGTVEAPKYDMEIFDGRATYAKHITEFMDTRNGALVKNSTLL